MSSFRTSRTTHSGTTAARRGAVALAATALGVAALASSVPAYAAGGVGGGRAVRATSVCDAGTLKLKAKPDTGGVLEVGAELSTAASGQEWTVSIVDNGVTAWTSTRTTIAPSNAFAAAAAIPNLAGQDVLTFSAELKPAVATSTTTTTATAPAITCSARVTVR